MHFRRICTLLLVLTEVLAIYVPFMSSVRRLILGPAGPSIAESGRLKPLTVRELCFSAQPCHFVSYILCFCSGFIFVYYYYVFLMNLFFHDSFSSFMANFDLNQSTD